MNMSVRVGLIGLELRMIEYCCARSWIWHL